MKGSLSQVLQGFQSKPVKTLTSAVITDVYTRCEHVSDLADLVSSGYFETVLWRFFHADASNSHLELLLLACAQDSEARATSEVHSASCLDILSQDPEKLNTLLVRILQATMALREKESRLQTAVFLFLRASVLSSSALFETSLYPKWKSAISTYLMNTLAHLDAVSPAMSCIFHSFLSLVLACTRLENDLGTHFKHVWVYFLGDSFDLKTRRLASLLLSAGPGIPFVIFVAAVKKLGLSVPSANDPSQYSIIAANLQSELADLPETEINALASDLFGGAAPNLPNVPQAYLPDLIAYSVAGSGLSSDRLKNPTQFTEEDIFDLFDCNKTLFCPCTTPYTGGFEAAKWTEHLRMQYAHQLLTQYNERCISVFSRLKVDDPASENGVSGSSKYFSMVSQVSVHGSGARIQIKKSLPFEKHQFCLLLELMKPNKFDAASRMVQWGINAARVMRVNSCTGDSLNVQWNASGYEDRFNAVVALPETFYPTYPLRRFSLQPEPADAGALENEAVDAGTSDAQPKTKKQKTKSTQDSKSDNLSQALHTPVSCIHAPAFHTVNKVLDSVSSCLVVLPTQAAVDLFPARAKCFRFDSVDSDYAEMVQKKEVLLKKVQLLSQHLGLADCAFDTSVKNALMMYDSHIEPRWQSFLKHLSESTYGEYPFRTFSAASSEAIIDDFTDIRHLFASLQELLVLEVVPGDVSQVRRHLARTAHHVVVSETQMAQIDRDFDTVVVFSPQIVPFLGGYKKLVLVNSVVPKGIPVWSHQRTGACDPTFQYVQTSKQSEQARLEEARYCLSLYRYLRNKGIPQKDVSICCKSKLMEMLLGELLAEDSQMAGVGDEAKPGRPVVQEMGHIFPTEHLIVSGTGGLRFTDVAELKAKCGAAVYVFGPDSRLPCNIRPQKLTLGGQTVDLGV